MRVKPKRKRSKPAPATPPETAFLLAKIKRQLAALNQPPVIVKRFKTAVRDKRLQILPTVAYYQKMDPCWMSTMSGEFAGRVVGGKCKAG